MSCSMIPNQPSRFVAHEVSLQAARRVFEVVQVVPVGCRYLADQARRAVASVPLNLAEGSGRAGRDRVHHFRIAYGSAKETQSAVRLLVAVGGIGGDEGSAALALVDRAAALTWKLIRNPGPGS